MVGAALQEHTEASHALSLRTAPSRARLPGGAAASCEARAGVEPAEGPADPTRAIGTLKSYIFRS